MRNVGPRPCETSSSVSFRRGKTSNEGSDRTVQRRRRILDTAAKAPSHRGTLQGDADDRLPSHACQFRRGGGTRVQRHVRRNDAAAATGRRRQLVPGRAGLCRRRRGHLPVDFPGMLGRPVLPPEFRLLGMQLRRAMSREPALVHRGTLW
jgi:hypothetical protein